MLYPQNGDSLVTIDISFYVYAHGLTDSLVTYVGGCEVVVWWWWRWRRRRRIHGTMNAAIYSLQLNVDVSSERRQRHSDSRRPHLKQTHHPLSVIGRTA